MSDRALVIVDVQQDFCEGGRLAVPGGTEVARRVSAHVLADDPREGGPRYAAIVATADWHVDPGDHWAAPGVDPDYRDSWPVHCEVGSGGEDFHDELKPAVAKVDAIFRKGHHSAAYSGFEGMTDDSSDSATLAEWLRGNDIRAIDVCGIATDHCVRATALDGVREGFETTLLLDLCAAVSPETGDAAVREMRAAGVTVV